MKAVDDSLVVGGFADVDGSYDSPIDIPTDPLAPCTLEPLLPFLLLSPLALEALIPVEFVPLIPLVPVVPVIPLELAVPPILLPAWVIAEGPAIPASVGSKTTDMKRMILYRGCSSHHRRWRAELFILGPVG